MLERGVSLGFILSIVVGCTDVAPDDDDVGGDTSSAGSETSQETGDETSGPEGETGDGDGDGDGDMGPQPCTWTNFPSQYGIATSLGENCGALTGSATQEELDGVLACLETAYNANMAAYASIDWYDGGDNDRTVGWYVRPPEDTKPRRIETQYFKQYVEEGPPSTGTLTVMSCGDFVKNCDDFPSGGCEACTNPVTIVCLDE